MNRRATRLVAVVFSVALGATSFAPSARAAGADPAAATAVQREQAQSRFLKGRKLYLAGKYSEAVDEFRASHDIVASPNSRLYLARALRENDQLVEAYVEFGRASVEASELAKEDTRYTKASSAALKERDALAPKLGFVLVHVEHATPETKLVIGDQEIRRAGWTEPAPVAPGSAEVRLETPGRDPVKKSVTLAAGEKQELTLDVESGKPLVGEAPPPPPPPAEDWRDKERRARLRTYAYIAGGVGAVGLVTFAVAGLLSNGTYSDLEAQCGAGPCPASMAGDVSRGRTEQTIANVGLVVGIVGAATGVTLFVLSSKKSEPAAPQTSVVVGPSFVGVRGSL